MQLNVQEGHRRFPGWRQENKHVPIYFMTRYSSSGGGGALAGKVKADPPVCWTLVFNLRAALESDDDTVVEPASAASISFAVTVITFTTTSAGDEENKDVLMRTAKGDVCVGS